VCGLALILNGFKLGYTMASLESLQTASELNASSLAARGCFSAKDLLDWLKTNQKCSTRQAKKRMQHLIQQGVGTRQALLLCRFF
jgi:hypothetical protein